MVEDLNAGADLRAVFAEDLFPLDWRDTSTRVYHYSKATVRLRL